MNAQSAIRRLLVLIIPLLLVSAALIACGSDDSGDLAEPSRPVAGGDAETMAASGAMAVATTASASGAAPQGKDIGSPDLASAQDWNRLVIRTAQLSLTVTDVAGATIWARDVATAKGGYVFSSSTSIQDDRQFSQITLQVPVDRFDETINELRSGQLVDRVQHEESSSQDVSAEFVDNESRLKALRKTELRFLALLGKAETVEDILRLEYELNNVRSQIETIQGRQNYLEKVTSFSTISVSLLPVGVAVTSPDATPRFSVSRILERAWLHSRGAIEGFLIAAITVTIFGAAVLPFGIVLWFGWRAIRARTSRAAA